MRLLHPTAAKRKREIATVLTRNGFEWAWSKWGIGRIFGHHEFPTASPGLSSSSEPVRFRLTLEELGTTFIKVGQMLSTRQDLVPPEFIEELSKLQDHVPEVPYADIEAEIEAQLGGKPEDVFQSFEKVALAAASIGQVHRAVLPDGTAVVVKVRRPGIELQVDQDLAILGQVARFLAQNTEVGKRLDLSGLVDEFSTSLRNELDFVREGQNAERIAADFEHSDCLYVPKIYWDFSCHSVLTMEEISGIKIDDLAALDAAGIDRHALAEHCAKIALEQVLDHGFFHADPHPGNFFVYQDGVIALIDYGMVGRLSESLRESLVRLALAVSRRDPDRLIDELLAIGSARGPIDRQRLRRDVDHLFQRYDGLSLGQISATQLFRDITTTAHQHALALPSDLVLLVRVFAMDEGMGTNLDPDFNMLEFAQPFFKEFWLKSHSVKTISERLRDGAIDWADIGLEMPSRLMHLAGALERGELKVVSQVEVPELLSKKFQQAANRIAMSVLTAGLVVGLSILTLVYRPTGVETAGFLALKLLLGAGIACGVWLLVAFWKSSR